MRLDYFLVKKGYFDTRTKAKQSIDRGEIYLDNKQITKPSLEIKSDDVKIERIFTSEYVSLGGFKMEKALKDFNFSVENKIIADIGSSTGGFTDCVLKNGAKKVYSVDLREDLLHDKLKQDARVKQVVKNAKDLVCSDFNNEIDMIVADLSFISVTQVLPVFYNLVKTKSDLIILIKPQFETGSKQKFKNGIIKDKKIHQKVCKNVYDECVKCNLLPQKITTAPIVEGKNTEFLIWLKKDGENLLKQLFE